jgi:hypothetical protein
VEGIATTMTRGPKCIPCPGLPARLVTDGSRW